MNGSHQTPAALSSDELRAAVRAVLRDVLPAELVHGGSLRANESSEPVTLRNDGDLDALIRRVAALCEDPGRRAALRDGRHGFRLAAGGVSTGRQEGSGPSGVGAGVLRVDRGAVTERMVAKAAADGIRLVIGPRAVLTPLARDKARVLGVEIEKES